MLQNAYFLAKIGADTAENEQHFAEICQKLATGSGFEIRATEDDLEALRAETQRLKAPQAASPPAKLQPRNAGSGSLRIHCFYAASGILIKVIAIVERIQRQIAEI